MSLVTMGWRQPERPSNFFGKDAEGPHDEQLEEAAIADARAAVVKKAMLGCELTVDELATAHLTKDEAVHEAGLLLERTETQRKHLTEPPLPAEPQHIRTFPGTGEPTNVYTVDVEPDRIGAGAHSSNAAPEQPAPKHRRKKRDTSKTVMREAIEYQNEEKELFR